LHRFNPDHHARLDDAERFVWQDPAKLIAYLGLRGDETLVDYGAGTGFFAVPLAERLNAGSVIGVDVSEQMLSLLTARVAEHGLPNVAGLLTDGQHIDLPDSAADLILLANVWHEITDSASLVIELRRILKPGGRLVVIDWGKEDTPVGPPIAERIAASDTLRTLATVGFSLVDQPRLYPYNYTLVLS
jgi:ubiquinone/menaquinone biosynthesis C-methylase UbiE